MQTRRCLSLSVSNPASSERRHACQSQQRDISPVTSIRWSSNENIVEVGTRFGSSPHSFNISAMTRNVHQHKNARGHKEVSSAAISLDCCCDIVCDCGPSPALPLSGAIIPGFHPLTMSLDM
jgi:hypothetical protein